MSDLVTTYKGTVHRPDCKRLGTTTWWPWDARNDGPGVATACQVCLPEGLPEGEDA